MPNTINFPVFDDPNFISKEDIFMGREAVLVNPRSTDSGWTEDNLYWRSLIYDKNTKEILSCGFRKFFNMGQSPELYPDPNLFDDWTIYEKIDGSLVVVDIIDGEFSIRTRGAFKSSHQKNAHDFETIWDYYPKLKACLKNFPDRSFLFELTTPNNRIVVSQSEVNFTFIGAIDKPILHVLTEQELNQLANYYEFKRPQVIYGICREILDAVKLWEGQEGIVLTYNNGQSKVKVKSDWYCFRHRIMSGLTGQKFLVDKFIELDYPTHEEFFEWFVVNFDYEIAKELDKELTKITKAYAEVKNNYYKAIRICDDMKFLDRKDYAKQVRFLWTDWRASVAYDHLDGKPFGERTIRKALELELSNELQET